jgi:hypothetical protein
MSSDYVGIDVHRRRSQIAVVDQEGTVLVSRNVTNGVDTVLSVIGSLPAGTPVAFEAAYGWGWLVELLDDYGFAPHLVHPLRCTAIASARLKNDKVDAAILAQLLRADLLPEAWIASHEVRWQRALLRHRFQLVRLRTLVRNRIHAVLADHGQDRPAGRLPLGDPLQHPTTALRPRLPQPRRVRTPIRYPSHSRITNGVHASGTSPLGRGLPARLRPVPWTAGLSGQDSRARRSISCATERSSPVSPPAECVDSVKVTRRQRISISG